MSNLGYINVSNIDLHSVQNFQVVNKLFWWRKFGLHDLMQTASKADIEKDK